jgi:hypothetical protein
VFFGSRLDACRGRGLPALQYVPVCCLLQPWFTASSDSAEETPGPADERLANNPDMPSWNPGFSRLDACRDSGILPEKPDPAEAGTPILCYPDLISPFAYFWRRFMKLPHQQVKSGHFCDVSLHMTAHVVEMFYTYRYRVGRSGEHVPKSASFSCSSGDRISCNALKNKRAGRNCSAFYGCALACIRRLHAAPLRVVESGGVEPPFLPTMRGVVQEHTLHPNIHTSLFSIIWMWYTITPRPNG